MVHFVLKESMIKMLNLHHLNFQQELLQGLISTWMAHPTIHYYSMRI